MLDYQRIVDDLRSSLQAGGNGAEFLHAAAGQYAAACEEANERLRKCGDRLRQGLRSEALQLCEIEPNLVDVVQILDYPEREQWQANASRHGIAPPPRLLVEVAAELNEAYAAERPLEPLLQEHRLRALARSPLPQRIAVLRQLAEKDSQNPIWQEDLSLFERERIKQIHQEAHEAAWKSDAGRLSVLVEELRRETWVEPPPPELVQWMTAAQERLRLQQAVAALARVEAELNAAFSAMDVEKGRRLREAWHAGVAVCGGALKPEVLERAGPALDWLAADDQKRRSLAVQQAAAAALQKALNDRLPLDDLEELYDAAAQQGCALAPQVADRYEARVAELERASARRARWLVAGVAAMVVLIGAIASVLVLGTLRASAVQTALSSLDKLMDEGSLADAQQYLDDLAQTSPRVRGAVAIQDAAARLQNMVKEEADRRAEFEKCGGTIETSLPEPDPRVLARADALAKSAEEKARVRKWKQVVAEHHRDFQEQADQRLDEALAPLKKQIAKLWNDLKEPSADLGALESTIAGLRSDLLALKAGRRDASGAAIERLEAALADVAAVQAAVKRRQADETAHQAVTQGIGDVAAYKARLERYVIEFPDSSRAADFKRAIAEAPLWEGVEKWNEVVGRWRQMQRREFDGQTVGGLLTLVKSVLEKHGDFPQADGFRVRLPYLEAIARRLAPGEPIQSELRKLFSDPIVANVWMLEDKGGRRYYLQAAPSEAAGQIKNFQYIASFDLNQKPRRTTVMRGDILKSEWAPQVTLAKGVAVMLATLGADNWETSICGVVQAIHAENRLDPLLQATLLQKTLELGGQGSVSLQQAFASHLQALKKATGGQAVNWLDPKDDLAVTVRAQVVADLQAFRDVAAASSRAVADAAAIRACPARSYRWMGRLCRSPSGQWTCAAASAPRESGRLLMVRRATATNRVEMAEIGRVANGVITLTAGQPGFVEGRPVYLESDEGGSTP